MRKQLRKIISVLLFTITLLSSLSVSSFGATNLINDNLTTSGWSWLSEPPYTFTPSLYYNSSTTASRVTIASGSSAYAMRYTSVPSSSVYPNDTYTLSFDVYGDFSKCNLNIAVTLNGNSTGNGAYLVSIYENFNNGNNIYTHGQVNFVPSNIVSSVDRIELELWFIPIDTSSQVQLYIKNLSLTDVTDDSGMWSRLWTWLQNLYNKLGDMLNSLVGIASNVGQGFSHVLTDVKAFIVGGTDHNGVVHQGIAANIGNFITNLGSTIGGFFENLWDDLSDAFDSIGQWFVDLGEDIGDFFTMLKNYLLYFRHPVTIVNGVPVDEHGEPIYENIFDIPDFFDTLEDWVDDLDNAKTDVETGASAGVQAFEDTISPLASILNRVPFLTVFVTFALAVIIIKKVIG